MIKRLKKENLLIYLFKDYTKKVLMRYLADSNRRIRFCRPAPSHSAKVPCFSVCKDSIFLVLSKVFRAKKPKRLKSMFYLSLSCDRLS